VLAEVLEVEPLVGRSVDELVPMHHIFSLVNRALDCTNHILSFLGFRVHACVLLEGLLLLHHCQLLLFAAGFSVEAKVPAAVALLHYWFP